jgi:predicted nucleotidyltransferase
MGRLSFMRLTAEQIEIIRRVLREQFGNGSRIWLFGSRTDDAARGGDIDLYVEPDTFPSSNTFLLRQQIKRELEHLLRNAVDLVVKNGPVTAFMRMAKRDGIPL